jgi:hypothetical protein
MSTATTLGSAKEVKTDRACQLCLKFTAFLDNSSDKSVLVMDLSTYLISVVGRIRYFQNWHGTTSDTANKFPGIL